MKNFHPRYALGQPMVYTASTLDEGTIVNNSCLVLALVYFLSAPAFAISIDTPRDINPAISVTNPAMINAYLKNVVQEYEFNPGGVDLTFYFNNKTDICHRQTTRLMVCRFNYLAENWHGSVEAMFKVDKEEIIELSNITFDGNY